jgi:hypothetical protein
MTPWRDIAVPHRDILEGSFQEAEFAADLTKVVRGVAIPEYQDPHQFFARTYVTEGMRLLLGSVLRRLSGKGGDPVIQLQTAFGGGKTHSLMAIWHLCSMDFKGASSPELLELLDATGLTEPVRAKMVVLDGNALAPSQAVKHEGCEANTLWGELAWQLGGLEAYKKVEPSDRNGTSPGKEILADLLESAAPCVILIDELVAYMRQFDDTRRLPGGTLETLTSFLQALTEAATATPRSIVLASLPDSNLGSDLGGDKGRQALAIAEKYFGRVHAIWKPVTAQESFGVVRRRLFQSIDQSAAREVVNHWASWYLQNQSTFPPEVRESGYREKLEMCYPIHPTVFDFLYEDWSVLEKFQRTRGVLQLMALALNKLWSDNHREEIILPGSLPLDHAAVRNKLESYLVSGWSPVLDKDVDSPQSASRRLETDPRIGKYQSARRLARAVFLHTAPQGAGSKGLSKEAQLLATVQAGEEIAVFQDTRDKCLDTFHYLGANQNGGLYFDTRPNLLKEVAGRVERFRSFEKQIDLIRDILRDQLGGIPLTVQVFPLASDVPDDDQLRLVVTKTDLAWASDRKASMKQACLGWIESKGGQPRQRRNRVLLLLPDQAELPRLLTRGANLLAWKNIQEEIKSGILELTQRQVQEVENKIRSEREGFVEVVKATWCQLVVPVDNKGQLDIQTDRIEGSIQSKLGQSLMKEIGHQERVLSQWAPPLLDMVLQKYWWNRMEAVRVSDLWDDLCRYVYLPRLESYSVLETSLQAALSSKAWLGYADAFENGQATGLKFGERPFLLARDGWLIRKDKAAEEEARLLAEEDARRKAAELDRASAKPFSGTDTSVLGTGGSASPTGGEGLIPTAPPATAAAIPVRMSMSADLGRVREARSKFQAILEEMLNNLANADSVEISLDVVARKAAGFDPALKRVLDENGKQLGIRVYWE